MFSGVILEQWLGVGQVGLLTQLIPSPSPNWMLQTTVLPFHTPGTGVFVVELFKEQKCLKKKKRFKLNDIIKVGPGPNRIVPF